ncbi:MAG: tetratricopeptide repeat protein [Bacteroides sp.]|uniref:tetratricopeptide repeat protein n=1 Tax=Bacteroides sp. TaxID=29523 RepID=UPI0026E0CD9C|nr:tetratricopeptide repeat protein [Bacteroides sp.]MDO5419856.1 tetratricopeptide repeat protein [Bacteroides sp.]
MRYLLLAFSFFLAASVLCQSCKEETTAARPMLVAADSMMWSNPDSALLVLEQIPASRELQGEERALYALLLTQARYKSCVPLKDDSLIRIAVNYYKGGREKERLAQAYFYQGCVYVENEELSKAIELYLKSLELIPKRDSIFVAMLYTHLGSCYSGQKLRSIARDMYKKGYAFCVGKDSARTCYLLNDIGDTFLVEYQLDSALVYYRQALEMASALQRSDLLFSICSDIAALYNEQGRYAEAEFYISKALSYQSSKKDYTLACSTKGDILGDLNQSDSAIYYWKIGAESSNIYVKASSYDCLFREYKKMKLWKESTLYADSFFIYYDSIQAMNDRAELDKLMDNHLVELHKRELSARNQQIIAGLVVAFLVLVAILIILYLWHDGRRKKKYVDLQQRLMENRAKAIFLSEATEASSDDRNEELQKLEKERFRICLSLFETTAGSKRLDELKKATPSTQIKIADTYRTLIVSNIRKSFADVMGDLKERYPNLTNDDLLYCVLSLLRCPKDVILHIANVSADAIKVRKNRIKGKIDAEQFFHIFDY